MTRFVRDRFAKQYLQVGANGCSPLPSPIGEVETSRDISAEVRQIDVLFSPMPATNSDLTSLGLLGKFAASAAVFEPFRLAQIIDPLVRRSPEEIIPTIMQLDREALLEQFGRSNPET